MQKNSYFSRSHSRNYLVTILFYSILFYSILFYSILFYSILFYSILFYFILLYSILFNSIQFYSTLFYSILFYSILFNSILFYFIILYSILFYSIQFYSIQFYSILCPGGKVRYYTLLCLSLYCTALHYNTLLLSSPTIPILRNFSTDRPLDIPKSCFKFAPFDDEQNAQLQWAVKYAQNEEQAEKVFYSAIRINPLSTLKFSPLVDRPNSD